MDDTLPDDAWKDSFDKLLDRRPELRELNIIKKNVRASFNIDSSVENTNPSILGLSDCSLKTANLLDVPDNFNVIKKRGNSISTPCAKRLHSNLFACALSPITGMKLEGIQKNFNPKLTEIGKDEPRTKKQVCFEISDDSVQKINDSVAQKRPSKTITDTQVRKTRSTIIIDAEVQRQSRSSLVLQPGKWRKSLSTWRRTHLNDVPCPAVSPKLSLPKRPISAEFAGIPNRKSAYIKDSLEPNEKISHEKQVLRYCTQRKAQRFSTVYAPAKMIDTCKIGEGVYGEVFKYIPKTNSKINVVLKVIPIEGEEQVNGEIQKTFEQILPEIIISKEMSNLRIHETNSTVGFVDIYNVCLVKGTYPQHLIKLWEKFDDEKESENDHPEMFTESQLFIVLELKFAGKDMSTFAFLNSEQSYYALQQVILTLAVGEEAFQFEHRDLHWGNILIENTEKKHVPYKLNGKDLSVATKGVIITIIDYTLSRITVDECCHYNDLSTDEELFVATGDYQYDIYRMMRDELKNDWAKYAPKTNVLWLSYVLSKLIDGVIYKNTSTRTHRTYMEKLKALNKIMLTFNSAVECAKYVLKLK